MTIKPLIHRIKESNILYIIGSVAIYLFCVILCCAMAINTTMRLFITIGSIIPIASLVYFYIKTKTNLVLSTVITSFLMAFISLFMASIALDYFLFMYNVQWLLPNLLLHWVPFAIGCIIFKNTKIWNIVWLSIFMIYSILQHYIFKFRGSIFTIKDIANIRSALDVKSSYSFSIDHNIFFILITFGLTILLLTKINYKEIKLKFRIISSIVYVVIFIITPFYLNSMYNYGTNNLQIIFGNLAQGDAPPIIGNMLTVYYDAVYNKLEIPKDYNSSKAENILNQYTSEKYDDNVTIIAILNESWADLSRINNIDVKGDYLKHWHEFENVYKGYVTVSPYGGMTCNSEYEFLTGNSMYFLPDNVGVYYNYVKSDQFNSVSYMNDIGFNTMAFTTCPTTLWNIGNVYNYLGFKDQYYRDYFKPDKSELIHSNNMSDEAFYNYFNQIADNRDKSKSNFYFLTTMQNHSPYDSEKQDNGITLNSPRNELAENYLNLISKSDDAFHELTEHYKNDSGKVVIVMFGDHYPHLNDFYDKLFGKSTTNLTIEELAKFRQTPFIVWSNFDMKDFSNKFEENISLNYLMNDVFKISNIPLAPYQQFLEDVRKTHPIISGFGYKTDAWHRKTYNYDDILYQYHLVQYYRMFDD